MAKPALIYQLKATLLHIRPAIWRRLQVKGDIKLDKLHRVLQDAFGWTDSHLHVFVVGEDRYGMDDVDDFDQWEDETRVKLSQLASEKSCIVYEYDFGDSWAHEILVEKVVPAEPGVRYPRCMDGKRACPPEDCGGVPGYENLLEVIANPEHEEHNEMMTWLGGTYDPEAFDVWRTDSLVRSGRNWAPIRARP